MTLLLYLSLALSPVLLKRFVEAYQEAQVGDGPSVPSPVGGILAYQSAPGGFGKLSSVFHAGWAVMVGFGVLVAGVLAPAGMLVGGIPPVLMLLMTGGMLARIVGDVPGTLLQARGRLAIDNLLVAMGEWCWPGMLLAWQIFLRPPGATVAQSAAAAFLITGVSLGLIRTVAALTVLSSEGIRLGHVENERALVRTMVWPSMILLLGHLADFCYAPLNQLLLGKTRGAVAVAAYAPALQLDAALLLLTAAISTTLLPHLTRKLAEGSIEQVRRDYLRSVIASVAITGLAAGVVMLMAGPLLRAWLGSSLPEGAGWLARLVLTHTILGAPAGPSRALLLAAGRYRTYTAAALLAGVTNAVGCTLILTLTSWGPEAVIGVTIGTVLLRCTIWMPWYCLRLLNSFGRLMETGTGLKQEPTPIPVIELADSKNKAIIPSTPSKPEGV